MNCMVGIEWLVETIGKRIIAKRVEELHVEAIFNPVVFSSLLSYVRAHPTVMCMLTTPIDYNLFRRCSSLK